MLVACRRACAWLTPFAAAALALSLVFSLSLGTAEQHQVARGCISVATLLCVVATLVHMGTPKQQRGPTACSKTSRQTVGDKCTRVVGRARARMTIAPAETRESGVFELEDMSTASTSGAGLPMALATALPLTTAASSSAHHDALPVACAVPELTTDIPARHATPRPVWRALLTPKSTPGSRYSCGKSI